MFQYFTSAFCDNEFFNLLQLMIYFLFSTGSKRFDEKPFKKDMTSFLHKAIYIYGNDFEE